MKRSEINAVLRRAAGLIAECGLHLPPFAFRTPAEWAQKQAQDSEISAVMLGWDVTDFGRGDFQKCGLTAFTLRNGSHDGRYAKPYAEKYLISFEGQLTPYHFHWNKMEDIINRSGGVLCVQLYRSTEHGQLDGEAGVEVSVDGRRLSLPAGGIVELAPGESICLTPGLYHQFWAKEGGGDVVLGEVSMTNDDNDDNRFLDSDSRFAPIQEDEPPQYLLCNEYP